jgi:membrane protease YdiL (CAAX protease family)
MTESLKRLFLIAISLLVIPLLGLSLWSSLTEPQITDRLQLYQTDLLLHVNELRVDDSQDASLLTARQAVLGEDPLKNALEQYQEVRASAATSLQKFQKQLKQAPALPADDPIAAPTAPLPSTQSKTQNSQTLSDIRKQQNLIRQLDLRIGLLQAEQGNTEQALTTWTQLTQSETASTNQSSTDRSSEAADALVKLWSKPPQILPSAEALFQDQLEGWFRYKALSRLYELQQRTDALNLLQDQEQQIAQQTLVKLALVSTVPALGAIIGIVLIVWLSVRWLFRGQEETAAALTWQVPWNWETVAWVLIVGFFFAGQVVIPGLLALGSRILSQMGVSVSLAASVGGRAKAFYTLAYYLLLSGTGLFVLYRSVKPFSPLPDNWFRLTGKRNWVLWGAGGYFVALPLMFAVSLLNQQFWQGQGGSNPLLQIVLEEGDPVALLIFFLTAAVAAPIFEETLFRGFLLPSLTRYLPVWGAIVVSSLIFALAHLSLSEVLPLTTLGIVLGVVYTRSRGLLSSMLLHSLWNSVTMIGLFILGSGVE